MIRTDSPGPNESSALPHLLYSTHTHTHTHTETWGNTHTHSLTEPLSTDYSPCCGESVCATASAPRSAAAADSRESSPDGGPDHSQLKKSEQLPQSARINEAGVQPHSHTPVCLFVWSDYSRLVFFPGWSFRVIRINQPRMWSTRPVCSGRVLLLLFLLLLPPPPPLRSEEELNRSLIYVLFQAGEATQLLYIYFWPCAVTFARMSPPARLSSQTHTRARAGRNTLELNPLHINELVPKKKERAEVVSDWTSRITVKNSVIHSAVREVTAAKQKHFLQLKRSRGAGSGSYVLFWGSSRTGSNTLNTRIKQIICLIWFISAESFSHPECWTLWGPTCSNCLVANVGSPNPSPLSSVPMEGQSCL